MALARFTSALRYGDIPSQTRDSAKKFLLDGVGCLLAGLDGDLGRIAARAVARLGGTVEGQATVLVDGRRSSVRDAAFVNGVTLYSVGVNDIHRASVSHPGGCVVPVVLALGEWLGNPGENLLAAMVAGYELMGRLGRATMPSHWDRGFHATGTFGTFGATAAAARLLGLTTSQTAAAFGIAGSQAAGLQAFHSDGSSTMIFHAGRAAQNGIEAALLAQEGFTGPVTVFEDRHGFVRTTSDSYRMDALTEGLGATFEIDATSFRPYYGCTLTIAASGAMADILGRRARLADIDGLSIVVRCHPSAVDLIDNARPETLLAARLSMQFNVALVLVKGAVFVGDVTEQDLRDARLRALMPSIRLEADAAMSAWGSSVSVHLPNGDREYEEIRLPKGDPDNPMSWRDMQDKFDRLLAPLDQPVAVADLFTELRDVERSDGAQLMSHISALARDASRRRP